jgi:hypothetical protein
MVVIYCFLCQKTHETEHSHCIPAARFSALLSAFPTERGLEERLLGKKEIRVCCAWFAPHTGSHMKPAFAAAPPNKMNVLAKQRRRPTSTGEVYESAPQAAQSSVAATGMSFRVQIGRRLRLPLTCAL